MLVCFFLAYDFSGGFIMNTKDTNGVVCKKDLSTLSDKELELLWSDAGRNISTGRMKHLVLGYDAQGSAERHFVDVLNEKERRNTACDCDEMGSDYHD
jgi:hypothetical protein